MKVEVKKIEGMERERERERGKWWKVLFAVFILILLNGYARALEWENLPSPSTTGEFSSMGMDGEGHLCIAYREGVNDFPYTEVKCLYGGEWIPIGGRVVSEHKALFSHLFITKENEFFLAQVEQPRWSWSVYDRVLRVYRFNGNEWVRIGNDVFAPFNEYAKSYMTVTPSGEIYVLGNTYWRGYVWWYNGSFWQAIGEVSYGEWGDASDACGGILSDSYGNVYVIDKGARKIRIWDGTGWTDIDGAIYRNDINAVKKLSFGISPSNVLYAGIVERKGLIENLEQEAIYMDYYDGTTWVPVGDVVDTPLASSGSAITTPVGAIAFSPWDGSPYVVYRNAKILEPWGAREWRIVMKHYDISSNEWITDFDGVASGPSLPQMPQVVINQMGDVFIVWGYKALGWIIVKRSFIMKPDTEPPSPPQGLIGMVGSYPYVLLSWRQNTEPDLWGYNIYRRSSLQEPFIKLNRYPIQLTSFKDDNVNLGNEYYYRVTALDTWGNETPIEIANEVKVIIPSQIPPGECGSSPALVIDEPQNNELICGGTFTIKGRVLNEPLDGSLTVYINNIGVPVEDYSFSYTINLTQEYQQYKITVRNDGKCGTVETSVNVSVDLYPPEINTENLICSLPSPLSIHIKDISQDQTRVYVDGIEAHYDGNGNFSIQDYSFVEGDNLLNVEAIDGCGSSSSGSFSINVDTTPPYFTIDYPSEGQIICSSGSIVTGRVNDANLKDVQINNLSPLVDPISNTYSTYVNFDSFYSTIYGEAVDQCGHSTQRSVQVISDYIPAKITSVVTPEGTCFNYNHIKISVLVPTNVTYVTATVSSLEPPYYKATFNCSFFSPSASPLYNWYVCSIQLYSGRNNVKLYARSFSGCSEDTKELYFIYDNTPPEITFVSQKLSGVCLYHKVTGLVNEIELSGLSLYINNKPYKVTYKKVMENLYEWTSDLHYFEPGKYSIKVVATNCAGDTSITTGTLEFGNYWGNVATAVDRVGEYLKFAQENVDIKSQCVHDTLWNIVMGEKKSLREKVFALSYLYGDITGIKTITGKEPDYSDCELALLLWGAIYKEDDIYLPDKALWTIIQMEGSSCAARVIRDVLENGDSFLYYTLRRHVLGTNSKWLANVLFQAGFKMSTPLMERRAMELLSGVDISVIPYDELIEVVEGDYPSDKKEGALDVIVNSLLYNDPNNLSTEDREKIENLFLELRGVPEYRDKALHGLGLIGGYEDYLINELKEGEENSILLFALGDRGNLETAERLIDLMRDSSIEKWRRVMASKIALIILGRESPESELMNELKKYGIPFLKSVLFDSQEDVRTRLASLEILSVIVNPPEYSEILKNLLLSTDDYTLITESLSFARFSAECSSIEDIESISQGWTEELEEVNKWVEKIEDIEGSSIMNIGTKFLGGEVCKGKKEKCHYETGILGKTEEAISKIDEAIEKVSDDTILNRLLLIKTELGEFYEMVKYADEDIETYYDKIEFIMDEIEEIIKDMKKMKEVEDKMKEVKEKIKEIEEKLDEAKEIMDEASIEIEEIIKESGYVSLTDLRWEKNKLENFLSASESALEGLKERCSLGDSSSNEGMEIESIGSINPYQKVMGYTYDPDGDKLKGVSLLFLYSTDGKLGLAGGTSDSFGVYGATYSHQEKKIKFLELPKNVKLEIIVVPPSFYPYLISFYHDTFTITSYSSYPIYLDAMVPFLGRYKEMSIPFIGKLYFLIDMDGRAQQYLSERHKPAYYLGAIGFCGYTKWTKEAYFLRSAKRFYLYSDGNYGGLWGEMEVEDEEDRTEYIRLELPTEEGFKNLKKYDKLRYNDYDEIYISVLKYAPYINPPTICQSIWGDKYECSEGDNIIYTHVLPIGWFSHTKLGARYPNWFKIQYFTFFDFNNAPFTNWDHEGDWEWTCHFVEFGRILYIVYHYHGDKKKICSPGLPSSLKDKCDPYLLPSAERRIPQEGDVFIEAKMHGSRWKPGCNWNLTGPYEAATGWDIRIDNAFIKVLLPKGDDEQESVYWFGGKWGDSGDSPQGPRFKDWNDTKW